eukprot:5274250-Pyramimonas_sp.AAC.1
MSQQQPFWKSLFDSMLEIETEPPPRASTARTSQPRPSTASSSSCPRTPPRSSRSTRTRCTSPRCSRAIA